MFIAIVRISIIAIKFEDITVTFHPTKPKSPIIITTEKKQLLIGTIIHINLLNTYQRVAMINRKTPSPKTIISFLIKVIINPKSIIGFISLNTRDKKANIVVKAVYKIGQNILLVVKDIILNLFNFGNCFES